MRSLRFVRLFAYSFVCSSPVCDWETNITFISNHISHKCRFMTFFVFYIQRTEIVYRFQPFKNEFSLCLPLSPCVDLKMGLRWVSIQIFIEFNWCKFNEPITLLLILIQFALRAFRIPAAITLTDKLFLS